MKIQHNIKHTSCKWQSFTLIERFMKRTHLSRNRADITEKPARGQVKQYCFTLIELLVVIAIIAVLAGLLFPALNRGLITSRKSSCSGNLRQVNLAMQLYVSDYNEYIPCNYKDGYYIDKMDAYLKNKQVLTDCRTKNAPDSYHSTGYGKEPYSTYNVSYGAALYTLPMSEYKKISRITYPSRKITFGDSQTYKQSGATSSQSNNAVIITYSGMYSPDFRHGKQANFVFVDGRTKSLPKFYNNDNRLFFWGHLIGISEILSPNIVGFHDQYLISGI